MSGLTEDQKAALRDGACIWATFLADDGHPSIAMRTPQEREAALEECVAALIDQARADERERCLARFLTVHAMLTQQYEQAREKHAADRNDYYHSTKAKWTDWARRAVMRGIESARGDA